MKRIEKPKVFISYAWADETFENLVLSFASQLVNDGVDVVFDKWDLTEGNDTYAFMEKCVTDPSVTNVLMLLDPVYAAKADEHTGGVGVETQIISARVYKEVTQDKFLPVIMKRDAAGNVCKPTYLQGRLHFDLSDPSKYEKEYQRLVKKLYGEEVYPKPDLGKKPSWVDKPIVVPPKNIVAYNAIKGLPSEKEKAGALSKYLNEITDELIDFASKEPKKFPDEYILQYDETESIRNRFLQLIEQSVCVSNYAYYIANFFEETANRLNRNLKCFDTVKIRLHELFIYVIALLLKNKEYSSIGYLLGKTFFNNNQHFTEYGTDNYKMFYSGADHEYLDLAIQKRDNKQRSTGTGQHWIETIAVDYCSKDLFILADLICYNYSVYGHDTIGRGTWFPITYVYDNTDYNSSVLGAFSKKLVSQEYAEAVLPLFGFDTIEKFREKLYLVERNTQANYKEVRYPNAFESAPLMRDFIKAKDVGSFR